MIPFDILWGLYQPFRLGAEVSSDMVGPLFDPCEVKEGAEPPKVSCSFHVMALAMLELLSGW
jgi:hypothetical protein